jgi:halocyanin-like protein
MTRRTVLGAGGAAALTAGAGGAAAQETSARPDFGDWLVHQGSPVDGGFRDARGQSEVTVEVGAQGNGGPYAFAPANLWIDPGTTVTFTWVSNTHNTLVESQPSDADWGGHSPVENSGFEYSFTFETAGLYEYYCEPHLSLGMKAGIAVGDDVPTRQGPPGGGGGGGGLPTIVWPGGSFGSVFFGVLAGSAALATLAVLGAEFYRDRQERAAEAPDTAGPPTEAPSAEPAVELGHDDYDPVGTALLIVGYFLILVGMWVFTYFVEFLGNGPTVVG